MEVKIKNNNYSPGFNFLCGVLLFFLFLPANAQDELNSSPQKLPRDAPSVGFEHLGLKDGLQQGSIYDIIQDRDGFLWMTTQGGLHRYDGYEFKVYKFIPFDSTSISSSFVFQVEEASNGDIWVSTNGAGLNRMDRATGNFTAYTHNPEDSTSISTNNVFDIKAGKNGDLWVGTWDGGLNRLPEGEKNRFEHFRHDPEDPNSITSDDLILIEEGPNGMIWAGSINGLNRIDPTTGKVKRFLYQKSSGEPDPNRIVIHTYFPPEEPGIAWLGTEKGLVRLNTDTGEHERFLIESDDPQDRLNRIFKVVPDPTESGILWVARPGAGVARFNTSTGSFTEYKHNPRDPRSLAENEIWTLFADRSGTMWAGHYIEGLSKFNPGAVNFFHLRHDPENEKSLAYGPVWGMYEDRERNLWFATHTTGQDGFLTKVSSNGDITRYRHNPNDSTSLSPGNYTSFAEDKAGRLWIGTNSGLNRMDRKSGRFTHYAHLPLHENFARNRITSLLPTPDSLKLWVGNNEGLELFDTSTRRFQRISLTTIKSKKGNLRVLTLLLAQDGTLWAGTNEGIFSVDKDLNPKLISKYNIRDTTSISSHRFSAIVQRDKEPHILWIGTMGGGLNKLDTRTGTATHYQEKDGLANNTIYGILEDNDGTLWMSTNRGISNFDPENETFRNYGLDDGLVALEYDEYAYLKGFDGMMYFGSNEGVTAFMPEKLAINEKPPQVVLSGLKIFNKMVTPGPESLLKRPLSETKKISLNHDQNELTFDFVALHYGNPARNSYAYMLEGFDVEWVEVGEKRSATYTNIPPGSYTFRVKAANADGVWSREEAYIHLEVFPPWYRTWWAYIIFAVLLGLIIFGIDRFQRQRLKKQEQERTALREAELRAEAENRRRADTENLSKIGQAVTSTLSIPKVIERVYEHVNELMDAAIFGIGIYNEQKKRLEFPATKEKGEMLSPYFHNLNEENRLAIWCFKNHKEIIIGDAKQETSQYVNKFLPPIKGEDSMSIIYLPLSQQGRTIGVITTQSFKKNAYNSYHVELLRNLATYAAIALDNASAYRKLDSTLRDLKLMQEQLVQQEKLASLGQLTAGIAHEIKNPLNFVNNFSELSVELIGETREELKTLSKKGTTNNGKFSTISELLDDIESNLRKIHKHGSRADGIVRSMLQHSRGGSRTMEPIELNELIKEYVNLAFHGMRAGKNPINVEIDLQLDERAGKIPLIEEDFSRVIINLCNNAFEAMREKSLQSLANGSYLPKLTVRTNRQNGSVNMEFKDNGPGIAEENKDKILQPFFTTKRGTEGTGLGLSITNDIIKAHGGSLSIESTISHGTCFSIKLPQIQQVGSRERDIEIN